MAILFNDLTSFHIRARDGEIGAVRDILFDDRSWSLRYLVVDTNRWLPGKKVLISPESFSLESRTDDNVLITKLTKQQIKDSPDLEADVPVSRQYEEALHSFYGWTPYWTVPMTMSGWPYPDASIVAGGFKEHQLPPMWEMLRARRAEFFDGHLRSMKEVLGYKIETTDGQVFGEVEDAVLNPATWSIIDMVLHSRRWLPGGVHVVCSPLMINRLSASERTLSVSLSKDVIMSSPEFDIESYGQAFRQEVLSTYLTEQEHPDRTRDRDIHSHQSR